MVAPHKGKNENPREELKRGDEKRPSISSPLDIAEVRVLTTEVTASGDVVSTGESIWGSAHCHQWGRETIEFHSVDRALTLRPLPILERKGWLRLRNRTPGANAIEPRTEEKLAARERALGRCRLLPYRPPSSSPTRRGVVGVRWSQQ